MIELGKQYQTRDGCEARVYAVDGGGDYPVHGAYVNEHGWITSIWCKDGRSSMSSPSRDEPYDLVEVKPRIQREVWLNVYNGRLCTGYPSKEESDRASSYDRIACLKVVIDCEEGEGL